LHDSRDDDALARMSERYRQAHSAAELRRTVAMLSELRSASGVVEAVRATEQWSTARSPYLFCGSLAGLSEPATLVAVLTLQGTDWRVEALSVNGRQLDDDQPITASRCTPSRAAQ
jgi:hypothetical protein